MKTMKKRFVILATAMLLMMSAHMNAQIVILDDEFEGQLRTGYVDYNLTVPYEGGDWDQQYVPVGEGFLTLTLLGGAYLLTKRKKRK